MSERAAASPSPRVWRGQLLGAPTSITLWHADRAAAEAALADVAQAVAELEAVFSLQRADSALSRLNRDGHLAPVPAALGTVLAHCSRLFNVSDGAFDPTVQALWALYAAHFAQPHADPAGPAPEAVAAACARIGFAHCQQRDNEVFFKRAGMSITLNGVAQGYVTDVACAVLARHGLTHCLVNLGEYRALGEKPVARDWHVAVSHPDLPWRRIATVALAADHALATSAAAGTAFDTQGRFHHLFDPHSGRSTSAWRSVTVVAESAMLADGLSTALAVAPPSLAGTLLARVPGTSAILLDGQDRLHLMGEPLRLV